MVVVPVADFPFRVIRRRRPIDVFLPTIINRPIISLSLHSHDASLTVVDYFIDRFSAVSYRALLLRCGEFHTPAVLSSLTHTDSRRSVG